MELRQGSKLVILGVGRLAAVALLIFGALTVARGTLLALVLVVRSDPLVAGLLPAGLLIAVGVILAGTGWGIAALLNRLSEAPRK